MESPRAAKRKNVSHSESDRQSTKLALVQRDSSDDDSHTEGSLNSPISVEHGVFSAEQ